MKLHIPGSFFHPSPPLVETTSGSGNGNRKTKSIEYLNTRGSPCLFYRMSTIISLFVRSSHVRHRREPCGVANTAAGGARVSRRSNPAAGEVRQGHKNAAVLSCGLTAGTVQHRTTALPHHVHLRHLRHVFLHARPSAKQPGSTIYSTSNTAPFRCSISTFPVTRSSAL